MEHIQPYLDYFAANPGWAIVIIFLIAFGEALLIIGLFVPSTVVLVGAGTLVGTGHLPFWPVFLATTIGAIAGDQISYWAGRLFGDRLKIMWPLNRFPALVAKGEDFVRNHGGKSIAVGRFVPGVKAVVPGIVGMLGMSQPFFIFVNVTSGIVWGAAHVFPGILVGQGLALAGEFSGRLAILLIVLLVILAVLGWATRLLAAGVLTPLLNRLMSGLSRLVKTRRARPFQRLARAMSPEHPRAARVLSFGLSLVFGALLASYLVYRVTTLEAASNLDQSVHGALQALRSQPGDHVMSAITMLGDWQALIALALAMVIWLFWHKAWRQGVAVLLVIAVEQLLVHVMKGGVWRTRPVSFPEGSVESLSSFPSGHAAATTVIFGLLAIVAGHAVGRWSRAVLVSAAAMVVFLVGFSRLYLGAHWFGDVLAGVAIAAVLVAVFGVVLEAYPARRIRPLGMVAFSVAGWLLAGGFHINADHSSRVVIYKPAQQTTPHSIAEWSDMAWTKLSRQRIDVSGRSGELFVAQWIGSLSSFETAAKTKGFERVPDWSWQTGLHYSNPKADFAEVPPRPLLHEGLTAVLTTIRPDSTAKNSRLVLRAYQTHAVVGGEPAFLISLLQENHAPRFALFTLPRSSALPETEAKAVMAGFSAYMLRQSNPALPPIFAANP